MRAAVLDKNNKIVVQEIEKPVLDKKGAIVKINGCGLCGSDIVKIKQGLASEGTVLGHEIVGEIVEIDSDTGFKAGDRIVSGHHVPCFNCVYCRNENYSMCSHFKATNILPGGFGEYLYLSEDHLRNTAFIIPEGLSDAAASFTEPVACCLRAVKRANVKQDDKAFVIGLGTIGLVMGQVIRTFGASVVGCDLIDERLEIAHKVGFNNIIKYSCLEETADLYKLRAGGHGADKVFLTSGSLSSLPLALSSVRDGGTVVVFASVSSQNGVFSNNDIYYRELTVMGSYSPSPNDLSESLKMINDGKIKVEGFSQTYNLDELDKAIDDTLSNRILKAYIRI